MNDHEHDDELQELFLQEGQEHLDLLQASLLQIEQDPTATDPVHDAFRAAHSIKGMAATMGHEQLTRVMHALEDALGELREGRLAPGPALVGSMLGVVDDALDLLALAAAGTTPRSDRVSAVDATLQELELARTADSPGAADEVTRSATVQENGHGPAPDVVELVRASGLDVLHVVLRPAEDSLMPAARAFAAVLQAQDHGELVECVPAISRLEEGDLHEGAAHLWIATSYAPNDIRDELAGCTEIASVTAESWVAASRPAAKPAATGGERAASPAVQGAPARRTVRVDADRLDSLMHAVGELLVRRARVETLARELHDPLLLDAVTELSRAARETQAMVMDVRMVAIDVVFRRLPRLVRDLGRSLGKDVDLQLSGADTELDRTVIEALGDPLVHLVRNAMDHGIEPAEQRVARGKPARGTVSISARTVGGVVLLRVRDDGQGMDPDAIRTSAVQRGVTSREAADAMSDEQALHLCFAPGFSTRREVTDLSGRGVGLDVVRSSVRALGGDVSIDSSDEGTQMTIRLPLTLAVVPVLLVRCGVHAYAIQLTRVRSIVDGHAPAVQQVSGRSSIDLGDHVLPIIDLRELLGEPVLGQGGGSVLLVEAGDSTIALRVDEVHAQTEVVSRPVPNIVSSSSYLSASATLGDGDIAFLLDTDAVAETATNRSMHAAS